MFDYLRNLTKSADEKREEALNAYLDDALSLKARRQFERLLAEDSELQTELAQRRALKEQFRQLPRRRVPRNFTLDPAVYGRPQRQPLFQLYPVMQTAAVLTAIFFILALGADLFMVGQMAPMEAAAPQDIALVEVTRVVTETVVEEVEAVEVVVTRVVAEEAVEEVTVEEPAAEEEVAANAPAAEEPLAETAALGAAEEEMDVETAEGEPAAEEPMAAAPAATTLETSDAAADAEFDTEAAVDEDGRGTTPRPAPSPNALTADTATKSTIPRPATATDSPVRAATAVPNTPQAPDVAVVEMATAVPKPQPLASPPISGLRLLQIGLGALLVMLGAVIIYTRRQF